MQNLYQWISLGIIILVFLAIIVTPIIGLALIIKAIARKSSNSKQKIRSSKPGAYIVIGLIMIFGSVVIVIFFMLLAEAGGPH